MTLNFICSEYLNVSEQIFKFVVIFLLKTYDYENVGSTCLFGSSYIIFRIFTKFRPPQLKGTVYLKKKILLFIKHTFINLYF